MNYVACLSIIHCEGCGEELYPGEASLDHPGHCLVCAGNLGAPELAPGNVACLGCETEWRAQHLSALHPGYCVWCAKKREARRLLSDRVIADVLARIPAAMARSKQIMDRRHDEPITSSDRDTRNQESA